MNQRNDREEIRRKLAMGTDDDDLKDDNYYYTRTKSITRKIQSSGLTNLQICFVNENSSDSNEELTESYSPPKSSMLPPDIVSPPRSPEQESDKVLHLEAMASESFSVEQNSTENGHKTLEELDFLEKQKRLQAEARHALALAKSMAKMQVEIEKQKRKKSSVAELAGKEGLTEINQGLSGRRMLKRDSMNVMTCCQLQIIVNDLHTQIEGLNEELMNLLILRDELQVEQDAMLVDIEDLTTRGEEESIQRVKQQALAPLPPSPLASAKKTAKQCNNSLTKPIKRWL